MGLVDVSALKEKESTQTAGRMSTVHGDFEYPEGPEGTLLCVCVSLYVTVVLRKILLLSQCCWEDEVRKKIGKLFF